MSVPVKRTTGPGLAGEFVVGRTRRQLVDWGSPGDGGPGRYSGESRTLTRDASVETGDRNGDGEEVQTGPYTTSRIYSGGPSEKTNGRSEVTVVERLSTRRNPGDAGRFPTCTTRSLPPQPITVRLGDDEEAGVGVERRGERLQWEVGVWEPER